MGTKLLLINPRKGRKSRKRRGRGKMPAALKAYWAGKRRGRGGSSGKRRRKSRARRNPRLTQLFSKRSLSTHVLDPLMAAGLGGAAAVALDVGLAYLPLPESVKDNALVQNGVKIAGAIALGYGASKVLGRERGKLVTVAALTVAAYGAIREGIKRVLPEELAAKVRGLGGIADYTDYALMDDYSGSRSMGMLEYQGGARSPSLGNLQPTSLGALEDPFEAFDANN